jgi:hypothetical protein
MNLFLKRPVFFSRVIFTFMKYHIFLIIYPLRVGIIVSMTQARSLNIEFRRLRHFFTSNGNGRFVDSDNLCKRY